MSPISGPSLVEMIAAPVVEAGSKPKRRPRKKATPNGVCAATLVGAERQRILTGGVFSRTMG
jgi:hypothetical protein